MSAGLEVEVLLFAAAAQLAGRRAVRLKLAADADLQTLADQLALDYPALKPLLPISRWAVNQQFMPLTTRLSGQEEVALIPPVSGG